MSSSSSSLLLPLSRKLLLHNTANPPSSSSSSYLGDSSNFDANVVMVLSVLLCALICSLGLNSIIRCALRCSNLVVTIDSEFQSNTNSTTTSEVIRSANTGVKKKALKTFPTVTFSSDLKLPGLDSECVICLSDFANGDRLRILPTCNHGFHIRCIDKWLSSHSSCPKCRHSLIHTCHKIVSSSTTQSSSSSNTILTIHPLQPEPLIPHYRQLITN